jgi:hypothetical protein
MSKKVCEMAIHLTVSSCFEEAEVCLLMNGMCIQDIHKSGITLMSDSNVTTCHYCGDPARSHAGVT